MTRLFSSLVLQGLTLYDAFLIFISRISYCSIYELIGFCGNVSRESVSTSTNITSSETLLVIWKIRLYCIWSLLMSSCDSNFLLPMLDHWATSCFLVSDDVFCASTVHHSLSTVFFLGVQYSQLFLFVLCLFPVERRYTRTSPFFISFHEALISLFTNPKSNSLWEPLSPHL